MRELSSRILFVSVCAWTSVCLLFAGWLPDVHDQIRSIWTLTGLMGLVSAIGLAEVIKSEVGAQKDLLNEYMQAAMTDGLTGLANRQALNQALHTALEDYAPDISSVSLIMLDIDQFKEFNDQHGHLVGDAVLQYVSNEAMRYFKGRGCVARYGGEEFAVAIVDCRLQKAFQLAEEFREQLANTVFEHEEQTYQVTFSAGVAEAHQGDSPEEFIRRADVALYSAKNLGRNQVAIGGSAMDLLESNAGFTLQEILTHNNPPLTVVK